MNIVTPEILFKNYEKKWTGTIEYNPIDKICIHSNECCVVDENNKNFIINKFKELQNNDNNFKFFIFGSKSTTELSSGARKHEKYMFHYFSTVI